MKNSIIKNISAKKFFGKIKHTEKYACMTWSRSQSGWKKIIAFNPVDKYLFKKGEGNQILHKFLDKNKGKLIIGYVSYDFGYELYNIKSNSKDELGLPDLYFLAYNNFIEFKNNQAKIWYTENSYFDQIKEIKNRDGNKSKQSEISNFKIEISQTNYKKNFDKIIDYIKSGDIYQVNYTHRMTATTDIDSRFLFLHFLENNPVDFTAYIESDDFAVCSLSPERFIKIEGQEILSQPIKGTAKRSENVSEDNLNKNVLLASEKEKAELFMIVDLIRNDLGKICEIGSVEVAKKRALQKLPKVFHTCSTVKGILINDIDVIDALFSMFPGGSITGCPKKRAMEIIDEIEPIQRGIYTGSIGYILPNGDAEFNIAIRTIVQKQKKLYLGVGGGITIESNMESEFEETLAKAQSFFEN